MTTPTILLFAFAWWLQPSAGSAPTQAAPNPLVGRWRVVGCATSPRDPAPCAHGDVSFETDTWNVALPCCKRSGTYTVESADAHRVTISTDGRRSEIRIDADGTAHWAPGLGGRVGEISFVRAGTP